jgi:hypothetical protein
VVGTRRAGDPGLVLFCDYLAIICICTGLARGELGTELGIELGIEGWVCSGYVVVSPGVVLNGNRSYY